MSIAQLKINWPALLFAPFKQHEPYFLTLLYTTCHVCTQTFNAQRKFGYAAKFLNDRRVEHPSKLVANDANNFNPRAIRHTSSRVSWILRNLLLHITTASYNKHNEKSKLTESHMRNWKRVLASWRISSALHSFTSRICRVRRKYIPCGEVIENVRGAKHIAEERWECAIHDVGGACTQRWRGSVAAVISRLVNMQDGREKEKALRETKVAFLAWSKVSPDHILNESALRLVRSFIYGGVALRWRYPSQNSKVSVPFAFLVYCTC